MKPRASLFPALLSVLLLAANGTSYAEERISVAPRPVDAGESGFGENRMSFSLAAGPLFDAGHNENENILSSTVVSWHWQLDDVGNPGWRRGNTEWITSAYLHPVWDGTESRFLGGHFGPRYNFVQEGWQWVPYLGARVGFGFTDSRDNTLLPGAQGQDFVFTFTVEAGARYVVNETIDLSFGVLYQHFSNAGLSEPEQINYGLDLIGPTAAVHFKF
ncbi:MAG: acyloxyacyl hydrolase [Candidatus Methylacidiphilales bacterium]|nr:acyloxyacyl hydrolase [Candidatus Methylacidiphilales bacterium]